MYFNTYPTTPDMGLRESLNAMLSHVAYSGHDLGYLPSALQLSNFNRLAYDFDSMLDATGDTLTIAPVVNDSEFLPHLADVLVGLCNDYPAYDDEDVSRIEYDRLVEMIGESRAEGMPEAHDIARALHEIGAYVEYSEYGANVSEGDFSAAVLYARNA